MDEPILALISLTMFVGSYFAGCIPLFFTLNEKRIRIASIFGAGLLVGTALCVIIPEGVSAILEATNIPKMNQINPPNPPLPAKLPEQINPINQQKPVIIPLLNDQILRNQRNEVKENDRVNNNVAAAIENKENKQQENKKIKKRQASYDKQLNEQHFKNNENHHQNNNNIDSQIGFPLLIGFLFMFIIEQLTKIGIYGRNNSKNVSTIGLVIHAFADGIAMGSASSAGGSKLEMQMLIFIAIMLHKAPAAFALVSILLAQGLDKLRIRRHLLIFSLAAPIGTVVTYVLLQMSSSSSVEGSLTSDTPPSSNITGLILLFSAGTFLYISTVHVMPELMESRCSSISSSGINGSRELLLGGINTSQSLGGRPSIFDIIIFCISALIPAFISSISHGGHGH